MSVLSREYINSKKLYNINLKKDVYSFRLGKGSYSIGYNNKNGIRIDNVSKAESKYIESLLYNSTSAGAKRNYLRKIEKIRFEFLESILKDANLLDYSEDIDISKSVLADTIIGINCADKFGAALISALIDAGCKNIVIDDKSRVLITDIGPIYSEKDIGKLRTDILKKFFMRRYKNVRLSSKLKINLDLLIIVRRFESNFDISTNLIEDKINHIFIDLEDNQSKISPIINMENNICTKCTEKIFSNQSTLINKPGFRMRDSVFTTTEKIFSLTGFLVSQMKLYYAGLNSSLEKHFAYFTNNGSYFELKPANCVCPPASKSSQKIC
ncbi:MAG: ThiF family adenylyltransferase [Bifidobacteriaceae bacterium]|nr:ThiF family adenylyltransferase [Bifidobacteriaceae bacterium]